MPVDVITHQLVSVTPMYVSGVTRQRPRDGRFTVVSVASVSFTWLWMNHLEHVIHDWTCVGSSIKCTGGLNSIWILVKDPRVTWWQVKTSLNSRTGFTGTCSLRVRKAGWATGKHDRGRSGTGRIKRAVWLQATTATGTNWSVLDLQQVWRSCGDETDRGGQQPK